MRSGMGSDWPGWGESATWGALVFALLFGIGAGAALFWMLNYGANLAARL
jgi:hypothetical protein